MFAHLIFLFNVECEFLFWKTFLYHIKVKMPIISEIKINVDNFFEI